MIPYGKQFLDNLDIKAVVDALKSDFLTTGPRVKEFEDAFAANIGSKYAVAVSNGTAALHLACLASGLKAGEKSITSPITFAASANCALYCGAKPAFADIDEDGLIDPQLVKKAISKKTKVIIPVDYSGIPCELDAIREIADEKGLTVIEDAAHALGAKYKKTVIGDCTYSDMTIFSFHPVKHITTGEGGMVTTNSKELCERLRLIRSHGITKDPKKISDKEGPWHQEMQELGFNYRLTDIQCALGISQLKKLPSFMKKRLAIAKRYDEAFKGNENIAIYEGAKDLLNAYHLYVIKVKDSTTRLRLFNALKSKGILCQVHYLPVYLHPYYGGLGYKEGCCPKAERFYERILSLPMYPALADEEQYRVIESVNGFF